MGRTSDDRKEDATGALASFFVVVVHFLTHPINAGAWGPWGNPQNYVVWQPVLGERVLKHPAQQFSP